MFTERTEPNEKSPRSKSTIIASLGALGSVILASSCCLPLLPFLFAAGTAGTSAFVARLRPYLLVLSVLLIAFGFTDRGGGSNAFGSARGFTPFSFGLLGF